MLLSTYMQRVQRLLGDTMFERFNPYDIIPWINEGRQQVAAEGECIRAQLNFNTVAQQELYTNAGLGSIPTSGIDSVITIISIRNPSLQISLEGRPWKWFDFYFRTLSPSPPTIPTAWSQFIQGIGGSFYLAPIPDGIYPFVADTVNLPIDLVDNITPDAIPFPWTDAVPFYAAHMALFGENIYDEADKMLASFEFYMNRARSGVTPNIEPMNYPGGSRARTAPGAVQVDPMQPSTATPSRQEKGAG